jgi:hypothetical protein
MGVSSLKREQIHELRYVLTKTLDAFSLSVRNSRRSN